MSHKRAGANECGVVNLRGCNVFGNPRPCVSVVNGRSILFRSKPRVLRAAHLPIVKMRQNPTSDMLQSYLAHNGVPANFIVQIKA
jgi:hypothetical protein